jgi:hypothetical protein
MVESGRGGPSIDKVPGVDFVYKAPADSGNNQTQFTKVITTDMKSILSALVLASVMTFSVNAAEKAPTTEKKYTADSCCDKAQKAGKACEHKCCVEAEKKGEVCGKCNK